MEELEKDEQLKGGDKFEIEFDEVEGEEELEGDNELNGEEKLEAVEEFGIEFQQQNWRNRIWSEEFKMRKRVSAIEFEELKEELEEKLRLNKKMKNKRLKVETIIDVVSNNIIDSFN